MARRNATRKCSGEAALVFERIVAMTDQFCREKLNEEYAVLCRHLAEKLARKRPSPLLGGKPETWACGIIRTMGWVSVAFVKSRLKRLPQDDDTWEAVLHASGREAARGSRQEETPAQAEGTTRSSQHGGEF